MYNVAFYNLYDAIAFVTFGITHAIIVFWSLFFQQIIPPGGNTSFDVVFLARVVGNVENTLFINTSHHGLFTYQVDDKTVYLRLLSCVLNVAKCDWWANLLFPLLPCRFLGLASRTLTGYGPS